MNNRFSSVRWCVSVLRFLAVLIAVLLVAATPVAGQVVEQQWAARVDGPPHFRDEVNAVATDSQGNTFVTGSVCIYR
jgi:hypothetical protein